MRGVKYWGILGNQYHREMEADQGFQADFASKVACGGALRRGLGSCWGWKLP